MVMSLEVGEPSVTAIPDPATRLRNWSWAADFAMKTSAPAVTLGFDPVSVLSIVITFEAGADTVKPLAVPASELSCREAPDFAAKIVPTPAPTLAPVSGVPIVTVWPVVAIATPPLPDVASATSERRWLTPAAVES
jgi:hypothetical protein